MSTLESIRNLERRMAADIIGQRDAVRNRVIGALRWLIRELRPRRLAPLNP